MPNGPSAHAKANAKSANDMRAYLANVYPGWANKLKNKPDNQIYAIYMDVIRRENAVEDRRPVDSPIYKDNPTELPKQLQLNL